MSLSQQDRLSIHNTSVLPLQETFDYWVEKGAIRALDLAFARFIVQQIGQEASNAFWLALILTSERTGHGHVCLDLTVVFNRNTSAQVLLSKVWDEGAAVRIQQQFINLLATASLTELMAQLQNCPAVTNLLAHEGGDTKENGTPLILAGRTERPLLYLRRYWQHEQDIRQGIAQRLQPLAIPHYAQAILDQVFGEASDTQTDWQKIACALSARSGFSIITGGPGTGKTTTVVRLLALLQGLRLSEGCKPLVIRLAAPTGKAAARLNESISGSVASLTLISDQMTEEQQAQWRPSIPTEASTLHRLLGSQPNSRHFRHNRANPLPADIVVVDEASMVDVEMMAKLMDALRPEARLILLGDKDQLASVEAGSVLGDLCQQAEAGHYQPETCAFVQQSTGQKIDAHFQANPLTDTWPILAQQISQATTMLRRCHRSDEGGGIMALAKWVNHQGGSVDESATLESLFNGDPEKLKHIILAPREGWQSENGRQAPADERQWSDFEQLVKQGYSPYLKMLTEPLPQDHHTLEQRVLALFETHKQFQLLCAVRQGDYGVEGLNTRIRQLLANSGLIHNVDQQWYAGRPVLVTQNDYSLKLMNGDIGICLQLATPTAQSHVQGFRVAFPDGKGGVRWILPSRLQRVETVFAMTVHKSQGSEFAHTALILPDKINAVLTKELLYTGITRSKNKFTLITPEQSVLEMALKQKISRASGLLG